MRSLNGQRGTSLLETIVGLGIVLLVIGGSTMVLKRYVHSAKHLEILGQVEDLKIMINNKLDCSKTIATQKATCDSGGHVALYNNSCSTVSGPTGAGSKVAPQYEVRAYCAKDAQGYMLDIEYRRLNAVTGSTPDVDPLTDKVLDWADLYKTPLRCGSTGEFVIRNGYRLPTFLAAAYNGYGAIIEGQSIRNDDASLKFLCQSLGFAGFAGSRPPHSDYSSPGNNYIWRLANAADTSFTVTKASQVGNASHLANFNLLCTNGPTSDDVCD